jgi:hypothetical protein
MGSERVRCRSVRTVDSARISQAGLNPDEEISDIVAAIRASLAAFLQ